MGNNGKGHEKQGRNTSENRRNRGRLSDADANTIIDGLFKQVKLYLGDKLLKGVGWLTFFWASLAIAEVASNGKVSLGAALRFIMSL